jgi:hypothetical protein
VRVDGKAGHEVLCTPYVAVPNDRAMTASADSNGQIEVDPEDEPLVLSDWLDAEQDSIFVGDLRLTAMGGDIDRFFFLPDELKHQDSDEVIRYSQIELIGEKSLSNGTLSHSR